jgi:hypothetical protein
MGQSRLIERFVTQSSKPLPHALVGITVREKHAQHPLSNLSSIVATIGHKDPFVLIPAQRLRGCMTRKDRFVLYGRLGLILAAFAMIGGVVAEPLFRPLWSPRLTVAQR